jgi:hypothetical protein
MEELLDKIEDVARFESLVHFPEKPRDPDWPNWVARATKEGVTFSGTGEDRNLALQDLLKNIDENRPALGYGR